MTDLSPLTALGGTAPRSREFGPLRVAENTALGLVSLALRHGVAAPTPGGLALPGPGQWADGDAMQALWTGRDQWMIEAPNRAEEDFASEIKRLHPECSVSEQTDAWVAFEITSQAGSAPIRTLIEALLNIDAAAFAPGSATRTGMEHMTVFAIRRAEDRLAILGMRSMAGSLWHVLETAAARQGKVLS